MLALLSFLETPLGRLAMAAAGIVFASAVAFGEGYSLRGKLDDAAGYKARAEWLQKQLDATNAAAAQEAAQAKVDNDALAQRLKDANNAVAQISNGLCLGGGDADRLRDLWGPAASHSTH